MDNNKKLSVIIAFAIIFPFVADHSGLWAAVLGTGQLSTIVLVIYTAALIITVVSLLVKTTALAKKEKWYWAIGLLLAFPFVALGLLYRLFWNPPAKL
jgi:ABC-type tungstate transport system substrate-binding protein